MASPEKLATEGAQDEETQTKAQHNMCWTPTCASKRITPNINRSYGVSVSRQNIIARINYKLSLESLN
jgi:hypothetical protein